MLRDLGAKMANKSAKMIFTMCVFHTFIAKVSILLCVFDTPMHRMREGSLKSHPQDGREHRVQDACDEFWLGGVAR